MTHPDSGGSWQPTDPNSFTPQQAQPATPEGFHQTGPQPTQPYQAQQPYQTQPYQAQQPYGQPAYGQQTAYYGYPAAQPPRRPRRGLLVGAAVAVLALVAGTVVTVVALEHGSSDGSATPTEAATKLVSAISQSDIAGVLSSLTPAEASLVVDLNRDMAEELKRLEVYKQDADPDKLQGVEIKAENLRFDDAAAEPVNDHVTITKLVDGKVTVTSDARQLPLTDTFLDLAMDGASPTQETETIDIGRQVRTSNEPIRIATVEVDGEWYPSLFYTIADYALTEADERWPAQPIAANGAENPGDAVRELAQAALNADFRRVIELLPPDEMGALHDAGPVLLDAIAEDLEPTGVEITKLETDTASVSGGTKVTLRELEIRAEGETVSLRRDGDCYEGTADGDTERLCAADLAEQMGGSGLPRGARQAMTNLATGLFKGGLGVVTVEVDGKYYVSPVRTFGEVFLTAMRSMQPEDITALINSGR